MKKRKGNYLTIVESGIYTIMGDEVFKDGEKAGDVISRNGKNLNIKLKGTEIFLPKTKITIP
jgi:hypothetical protein